jgi:hypothetical protein
MKHPLVLCLAACACLPCLAQDTRAKASAGEPAVKRTVIEDEGARIEELRVRGQLQRITVTTKLGGKSSYEIITGDGSRDLSDGANTSRGAAGKRAWNVLSF